MQEYYIHLVQEDPKGRRHFRKSLLEEFPVGSTTVEDMLQAVRRQYHYVPPPP